MANPEKLHPNTYPNTKSAYASSAEELAARQTDTEAWFEALYTWLPGWIERFAQLPDPRHPGKIQHKLTVVLVYGVMLFLWQCASRRAGNRELTQPAVWETLQAAFPALETIPHMDTVARVLERLPAEHLESILLDTVKRLLRNRRLASWMVQQHYLVAVDGTLKWSAAYPWASEALTKQMKSGDPVYQAYVVEAVLVCPQGIAIPLMAEFCENAVDAAPATKQDSELKAFYRLARRLKAAFPRLKLAILADGLYPNGPLFRFLRAYRWDFMLVLKAGNLKTFQADAQRQHGLEPQNVYDHVWGNRTQHFWWVNQLDYEWHDPQTGRLCRTVVHYAVCEETWTDAKGEHHSTWAWVSARPFSKGTIVTRCNRMARHRWDIEEHILGEKHFGYHYTHLYSRDWRGMQGFHALMRLAHLLQVLALHQTALWPTVLKKTIQGTIQWIVTTIAHASVDLERLAARRAAPHRSRLIW